ncbi:LuxR C-terminal-related transcriptional regulator [Comamonas faecalis]|uniref:LuxR C-terminal-related transcriptional regulator n=1 Tax=Comamonas faecalis TaxID=1387849 RepID=A0ABP7RT24_9BURK
MSACAPAPFLRTKIRVLRPPHGSIDRPRLDALREQLLQLPLMTLSAPGGFGKSTLAASWVAHWQAQGLHCTWLTLSQDEDEPTRFVHALAQALQRLGQNVGQAALALLQGRALAAPRAVLALLLNDLEDFDGQAIVVLDDYQWIEDSAIHDALAFFIAHAPPQLHVLITSRVTPALPLARLRAHGLWHDVDAAQLRFDLDEATRLLHDGSGPARHSSSQISALHASTEGWAAALRLAALGPPPQAAPLSTPAAPARALPAQHGGAALFATLFEDLLQRLPGETVRFMAQTAVLERLSPALCDAVGERADSAAQMQQLQQHHLLIAPMDSEGRWLRIHQLLREHLLAQVLARLGLDAAQLHRRAAQWFAQQGAWSDAVRHALQAGDQAQAAQWLAHCGMALVQTGDLLTLLSWRRQLPPALLAGQPRVQLAIAWGLALATRFAEAEPLLAEIEQAAHARLAGQALADTLAECLAIRAVNVALQDDSLAAGELARQWQSAPRNADAFTHNAVGNVLRYVHWKAGDLVQAYEQPWQATTAEEDRHNAFSTVYRHTILGGIELEKACLDLAERHAREALRCAHQYGGALSVSAALAAPLLAQLHYQRGDWREAQALLAPLQPLIDNTAMHESALLAYQVLVRTAQLQGLPVLAYEQLERGEAMGYNRGWDRLVAAMLHERVRLLIGEGRLDEANATCIRLTRLAAHADALPRCARSALCLLRDNALARLALAQQRIGEACSALAGQLAQAQAHGQILHALQLGTCLALAHMAADQQDACFAQLCSTLQGAQSAGAPRCILDEGPELQGLLARFSATRQCDGELPAFVANLLERSQQHAGTRTALTAAGGLTEREQHVLQQVAQGRSNKEIARAMAISAETVKTHLKKIFEKLKVQQRAQAVALGRTLGYL